ncbi:FAD-dependent oxidoreductase [Streptomyces sp. BI20]|uniref:FAD-dependent oxidoreductase n=1 Tax=Streptomyces sp. BI20 TaxID=3403460 RepID=UPI003C74DE3F
MIGAGPYGLSIGAHAAAAGLDVRVLGRPMASWRDHMPAGMHLKSEPWASDLSAPAPGHTLADYCARRGLNAAHGRPLPIEVFGEYGLWFADTAVPAVEESTVVGLAPEPGGYRITRADGEPLHTRAVTLAVGVMPFRRHPRALDALPPGTWSHSTEHGGHDLERWAGHDVVVLGAGQAALETASLLADAGARPTVVARRPALCWNTVPPPLRRPLTRSLRTPHSGLGSGWRNWAYAELPGAVRALPAPTRERIFHTALGPAGAWWLRSRFEHRVPVLTGQRLLAVGAHGDGVRLELAGGDGRRTVLEAAHVIAATGFAPDLDRLDLLPPTLRAALPRLGGCGAPALGADFESGRPGLFFAGLLAAPSFGPSMRFVHGAGFTAGRLVTGVRRRLRASGSRPVTLGTGRPRTVTARVERPQPSLR